MAHVTFLVLAKVMKVFFRALFLRHSTYSLTLVKPRTMPVSFFNDIKSIKRARR